MRLDQIKDIKRLVIYFFYDADGIVDRYVPYMLEDIKRNCSEIFVVCNGKLTPEGRATFKKLTPNVMVRENTGFDVWAYKTALEHYGWDKLAEYDEVVLMNFTMFGPLYPFSEMFEEMNRRDVDFWGITKHHGFPFDPFGTIPYGYIPEHIQSSFICVRRTMLNSLEFHRYWEKMPEVKSYGEAVGKHEAIFTKQFKEYGFKSDVYVNTDDLKDYTHYPLMLESLELIKNRHCPVFKRKAFTNEYYEFLNCCLGEPTVEMYEYIRDNCDYNLSMVWENLLRTDNMADIKNRMHLNYIMPHDFAIYPTIKNKCRIALIMHIYFEDQIESCMNYALSMPNNADVIITTPSATNKSQILRMAERLTPRKVEVLQIENRGRDVSAFLIAGAPYMDKYDLICFMHDKKTKQFEPYTIGKSFSYKCFENMLGSQEYVQNIIGRFLAEPRLGMMMPPPPNHAAFFGILGTEWGSNFQNTKSLAEDLNIHVKMDEQKEPIAPLGTMFWFRPDALKPLFQKKWAYKDFPKEPNENDGTFLHAIERLYGFSVQSQGYYSAWVMHDRFAAIELTNYHFMLREMSMSVYGTIGHRAGFAQAAYDIRNTISLRLMIKHKIKRIIPSPIWRAMRKVYRSLGGKKWVG